MQNINRNAQCYPYLLTLLGIVIVARLPYYANQFLFGGSKFEHDFIAQSGEFNRTLTAIEKHGIKSVFPQADADQIKFLGIAAVRPSIENCQSYECMPGTAYIYDLQGNYVGSMDATTGQIPIMQAIWDQCNSGLYKCIYAGHPIGATYNCIGHALGITKWLDPSEITAYINRGMTRHVAIDRFITDKRQIYSNLDQSNVGHVIDKLYPSVNVQTPIKEDSVAFFFNSTSNECLHGARYLENFYNQYVGGRWTSKLGSSITISHELSDLLGGVYGDDVYYAEIT
ncbi:hypothetical protein EDM53_05430 [Rickettsiales endosymbiont of Peranema trichophorum]|uniref:DUF7689 domain-containing protein n=1 Tax=Rickettsiales endosymbiont of Peranema trichophorum TaxID=2486577 RepID=UPI001023A11D|nr:hypothetical protein [Rickettsiales endosymbiont of Peranema trichophorum]RZI45318.1 hypothetical protein EDM53_05430 [Rickettsiales endosymbiont of Peranema trichophorum]